MSAFHYQLEPDWPVQAWIAVWTDNQTMLVRHGARVETESDWFGEIVWDGEYSNYGFDQTDIVFGSGGKKTDSGTTFVSSASTLDRLHSITLDNQHFVSNSLVCLIAVAGLSVDIQYQRYHRDFMQILKGFRDSQFKLDTDRGNIRLTYFRNLQWNGRQLAEIEKPVVVRDRSTFSQYQSFLEQTIRVCGENLRSAQRQHPFELIGTASTGFDSPTVAALGRAGGLKNVISIASSRSGEQDSGHQITSRLGLNPIIIERDAWQNKPFSEIPFLSVDGKGEDVYFSGAEEVLSGKVMLTGYCGSFWGGASQSYLYLNRTDPSGLSLSEYRLSAGFINFPLAVAGIYQAQDLLSLMASNERDKWASGKEYDKPFCRFVLSAADIPNDWYGVTKKAASVLIEDKTNFLSQDSLLDFNQYLSDHFGSSHAAKRFSDQSIRRSVGLAQSLVETTGQVTNISILKRLGQSSRISEFSVGDPRFNYLFPWAISHARKQYET